MKMEPIINELNNLIDHLMVNLEKIIELAFMTHIIELDAYELYPRVEKVFKDFINEMLGFHIILMIGVHYYSKVYLYGYVNDYI